MVRTLSAQRVESGEICYEFAGTSNDVKPVRDDICTGSSFLEVDTGDVFFYNEDAAAGEEWGRAGGT